MSRIASLILLATVAAGPSSAAELSGMADAPPGAFSKLTPDDGSVIAPGAVAVRWTASAGATSYEYCYGNFGPYYTFFTGCPDESWTQTTATSVRLTGLVSGRNYYWQVRARNAAGLTYANPDFSNRGQWWRIAPLPAGLYFVDDVEHDDIWKHQLESSWWYSGGELAHSGHTAFSDSLFGPYGFADIVMSSPAIDLRASVSPELRFWQYRDLTADGYDSGNVLVTLDGGQTYTFLAKYLGQSSGWIESRVDLSAFRGRASVRIAFQMLSDGVPQGERRRDGWYIDDVTVGETAAVFSKTTPALGAGGPIVTLALQPISGGTYYDYCYDTVDNDVCDGSWVSAGPSTSVAVSGLLPTTYYWQVRAWNSRGVHEANARAWWRFTARVLPAADFNHDVKPDLVWFDEGTRRLAAWNMGGGLFGERIVSADFLASNELPAGWRVVGAADANADGQTDLFLQSDSGQLAVWFFVGRLFRGVVPLIPEAVSDPLWRVRAVGDFNHDGHPDLVWQYTPTGQVAFWFLNDVNVIGYAVPAIGAPGPDWQVVGTGDSNHDGQLDLFWQHRTGRLAVWWMQGPEYGAGVVMSHSPTDPAWRVVATCDLDSDDSIDLVFQHASTGALGAWFLDAQTVRFGATLNPATGGDSNWKVVGPR